MDPFRWLESFVYILSTALFYPVLLGLVVLVGWLAVATGKTLRESLERRRDPEIGIRPWHERMNHLAALPPARSAVPLEVGLDALLSEAEAVGARALDRVRFAIRVGPSVGLMGTLIPMATALASLAGGDLPSLARNMVTAFSTTVVGLAVGTGAYGLSLVRHRWIARDLDRIRMHAETLHARTAPAARGTASSFNSGPIHTSEEKSDALSAPSGHFA